MVAEQSYRYITDYVYRVSYEAESFVVPLQPSRVMVRHALPVEYLLRFLRIIAAPNAPLVVLDLLRHMCFIIYGWGFITLEYQRNGSTHVHMIQIE